MLVPNAKSCLKSKASGLKCSVSFVIINSAGIVEEETTTISGTNSHLFAGLRIFRFVVEGLVFQIYLCFFVYHYSHL